MTDGIEGGGPKYRDYPSIGLAVLFALLGVWVLFETTAMTAFGSIFPRAIAIAMIVLSMALVVQQLRRPRRPGPGRPSSGPESTPRRVALAAVMAAWALSMPVVGFFVTSLLAFLVLLAVANYDGWTPRRMLLYGASGVVVVAGFYLLFVKALLVPVPSGWLF
ncbi:MAG: hypothetical protein HKM95_14290 [Inquilinus sp.]|nr:hypothetical protein [Inquilinus sp.]